MPAQSIFDSNFPNLLLTGPRRNTPTYLPRVLHLYISVDRLISFASGPLSHNSICQWPWDIRHTPVPAYSRDIHGRCRCSGDHCHIRTWGTSATGRSVLRASDSEDLWLGQSLRPKFALAGPLDPSLSFACRLMLIKRLEPSRLDRKLTLGYQPISAASQASVYNSRANLAADFD